MGLYDRVQIDCPVCGQTHEEQTKAGECGLITYNIRSAPTEVLGELAGKTFTCEVCGAAFWLGLAAFVVYGRS